MALICLGKVVLLLSRGRRRVKKGGGDRRSPAHVFHMVILIFQRDLCSPLSFPLCPVDRSTAAEKCFLCSVAPLWWCFCSFWQWTAQHLPCPHLSLESKSHKSQFVPDKELGLKNQPEGGFFNYFLFFLRCLFFPFCFLN